MRAPLIFRNRGKHSYSTSPVFSRPRIESTCLSEESKALRETRNPGVLEDPPSPATPAEALQSGLETGFFQVPPRPLVKSHNVDDRQLLQLLPENKHSCR